MTARRIFRASRKTAAERAREKTLRDRVQKERPSLEDLVRNGECDPDAVMTMGMHFDVQAALQALKREREGCGLSIGDVAKRSGPTKIWRSRSRVATENRAGAEANAPRKLAPRENLMQQAGRWFLAALLSVAVGTLAAQPPEAPEPAVGAAIKTTLKSASTRIRQFAFDGNPKSYFASADHVKSSDHFTLILDRPVAVQSIVVTTGRPDGGDQLASGTLEGSADGKNFELLASFADGVASSKPKGRLLRAVRINPGADLQHPVAIREIVLESEPAVAVFKYPIEVVVDVSDAPEMKDWAEKVAHLCERHYPMICDELKSDGFKPRTVITMTLKKDYKGVAAAGGGRITGSVAYFKNHPDDMGAMIHETVHCVQSYRTRNNPGWLVEGIADYVRFFKYERGKLGKINPDRARYNGSYRVTAAFLAFVTEKYDKQLVNKLNKAMREGEYQVEIWKVLTKKTIQDLDEEWRASLAPAERQRNFTDTMGGRSPDLVFAWRGVIGE